MIAGYHCVWTVYGYWLPNDPRGSMSREIRNAAIAGLGDIHYGRKKIQPVRRVLRDFHDAARQVLRHELLNFSAAEAQAIAASFAEVIRERSYTCYACAIMPDHIHILIRKHRDIAETMIDHLQKKSREVVLRLGSRAADHPVWGGPGWKAYLESRTISCGPSATSRRIRQGRFVAANLVVCQEVRRLAAGTSPCRAERAQRQR